MRRVGAVSLRVGCAACCAVVVAIAVRPARGDGWNPDDKLNNPISADPTNLDAPAGHVPAIAATGSDVAIAFSVARGTVGEHRVYAQLISHGGVTRWGAGARLATSESTQVHPAIVTDGAGGAIVVWQDDRFGDWDIFAQRVLADGSLAWDATGVCVHTDAGNQVNPVATSDGAGGVILAWDGALMQRLGPDGSLLWTTTCHTALQFAASGAERLSIVSDGAQGAIIAWIYAGFVNGAAIGIDSAGTPLWPSPSGLFNQTDPGQYRLVPDGSGGAFVAFTDAASGRLRANHVDAAGTNSWGTWGFQVPDYTGSRPQTSPNSLAMAPCRNQGDDGAVIAWATKFVGSGSAPQACSYAVEAIRMTSTGAFSFPPYAKKEGPTTLFSSGIPCGYSDSPILGVAITMLGCQALIAWGNVDGNVYAQLLRADQTLSWPAPVTVSQAPWSQSYPVAVTSVPPLMSLAPSCFVVAWNDHRRSPIGFADDVYASVLDTRGFGCSPLVFSDAPLWRGGLSGGTFDPICKTIVVDNDATVPVARNLTLYADQSVVDPSKGYKRVTGLFRPVGGGSPIRNPISFPPGRTVLRLEMSIPSVLSIVNRAVSFGSVNLPVGALLDDPSVDVDSFVVEADPDATPLVGGGSRVQGLRRRAGSDDDGSAEAYVVPRAPVTYGDLVCTRFAATEMPSRPYTVTGLEIVGGEFGGSGFPGLDAVELRVEDPIWPDFPDLTALGLWRAFDVVDGIGAVPTGPPPTRVTLNITDIAVDPTIHPGLVHNLFVCAAPLHGEFGEVGGTAVGVDQTPETRRRQSMVIASGELPGTYDSNGNYMLRLLIDGDRATLLPAGMSRESAPPNPSAGVYPALRR